MELELVEYLQGLFSLIFVLISVIVGIRIILRYFEYKKREFVLIGIAWIGMISGWIPDAINFLMIIFLDTRLSDEVYFIIGLAFLPFGFLCFSIGFMDILEKKKKREKLYLIILIILVIIYEIIFFYLFFSPTEAVGTFKSPFQVEFHPLIDIFLSILLIITLVIALSFVRQSLKSKEPEIKLKGKLLLIAFITIVAGATMDILIPLTPITVVIVRCILISSAILFHYGFLKGIEESEEKEVASIEEIHDAQDFLKMVSKHRHKPLTEEEITFYREQKICLVCKGKAIKFIYVCQDCDALYCMKCANALSNLENACWVCNAPIDESKPTKPFKKVEEEIDLEVSGKPQKKPKVDKKSLKK